jgi:hypothetical protein
MEPKLRQALEETVVLEKLRVGGGDDWQQRAFQELEWRRCEKDPVYWINNYGWIILKDGTIVRWKLWPVQVELLREWQEGKSTVAVKTRQLGITTLSAHFAYWEVIFKDAVQWYIVSKSESSAKDAVMRIQATKDRLPAWMIERASSRYTEETRQTKKDKKDAVTRISYGMSSLNVLTSTPKSVQGRSGKFVLDEFAAHSDQKRIFHLVLPSMDGGGQAIIIANGEGENTFYHIYQAAKRGENGFIHHFFSWRDDPTRDDEWYKREHDRFILDNPDTDEFIFKTQYPETEEEAFFLHGNSRFDIQTLNRLSFLLREEDNAMRASKQPWGYRGRIVPHEDGNIDHYKFEKSVSGKIRMYELPQEREQYVIGVDSAGGSQAGDYSIIMVGKIRQDIQGVEQVAVYQAKVETLQLAMMTTRMAHFYNDAFVVIETGGSGHGTAVANIVKEEYNNLYRQIRKTREIDEEKEEIGYSTNTVSKSLLIDNLANWMGLWSDNDWKIPRRLILHDSPTLEELSRFEIDPRTGNAHAPKGSNDDLVMATGFIIEGSLQMLTSRQKAHSVRMNPWEW